MKYKKITGIILSCSFATAGFAANPLSDNAEHSLNAEIIKNHPELTQQIDKNKASQLKAQGFANVIRNNSAYKEGRVIVRLKAGQLPAVFSAAITSRMGTGNIASVHSFRLNEGKNAENVAASRHVVIMESPKLTTKELIGQLQNNPAVDIVEPDYYLYTQATTPNDTLFTSLWGMNNTGQTSGTANADIDAPEAWDRITGNGSVTVGTIDTGIDYHHPELINNVWRNLSEVNGTPGVDDDANGYIDDIYGIDTFNYDTDPLDDNSHGTHVAGTIGGVGNNGAGVAGVAWNVKMAACKFLNSGGGGYTSGAIECLNYFTGLKTHGQNIVATNNSWGGGGFDQLLKDAIDASGTAGTLFIAAAGNSGTDNDVTPSYPASYASTNIIAVAATDHTDTLAPFSQYGATSVDLAAPGVNIVSSVISTAACTLPATPSIFFESFEAGLNQWNLLSIDTRYPFYNNPAYRWSQLTGVAYTGTSSASDSSTGNYSDYTIASMTKGVDLSSATVNLCGQLWFKGEAESGWDYMYVYLSNDGGQTWVQANSTTGAFANWTSLGFEIPNSFKTANFLLSVVRSNDYVINKIGYEVDDVGIDVGSPTYVAQYANYSGTSMATPHVTGAVALAAMAFPSENVAARIARVLNNVDPKASLTGKMVTGGRLNVAKMVAGGTDNLLRWPDFNGDAKYDLIWRNYSTGANTAWYMNAVTPIGNASPTAVADVNWKIVGTPDMNGDGKPDLLWRNYSTGANTVWYMNGVTSTGAASITAVADVNWKIVGTPDINGDGKPDLLWRNYSTGANTVWYMNGVTSIGNASPTAVADVNWKIVGTPDMNGDGKPDLLWRNFSTGANTVWYMNGVASIGSANITAVADVNWKIVATPDVNSDGKPDLLWRNYSTGANTVWYMNGITSTGAASITAVADVNWKIVNNGSF